ncbi:acyltransferase family protein [Maricaulis salignorans]|uniref:Peptidoglycan/LPS O-acetylase OafA/YrhL, contains acyltransferase and SGNH-hydrolase domains n=1 Tax=Maricaulis salignorans TaxID=144026 RepID=A0A1G9QQ00_9PROT|nr:acyltransferase family protein [Maricaulis salignorans]SDM12647.1 Peptidoglycan/LPS O-acetylase OafA/YrhL, contains acyltransferase and SGNH-hydrolase domains [Maricaulis salignorans]
MSDTHPGTTSNYRPDIDGLRALAVMAVVLFHIDKTWVPGGFIGVDIFFVISGFLITGNITSDIGQGRFSIAEFYQRRIKRIIPALVALILVTLVAGQIIMLPADFKDLSLSSVFSVLSLANFYFLFSVDTGYFADDSTTIPLLHLWTLGVEEQFYLLWPLILAAWGTRGYSRLVLAGLAMVALASFLLAQFVAPSAPMTAYYMLPMRAGQLLAGAICLMAVRHHYRDARLPRLLREMLALLSLALIAGSLVFIHEGDLFPGFLAIPVTLGAVGLIYVGSAGGSLVNRALSFRPFVWIGLISYSLYLWHWPVLAFARYLAGDLDLQLKLICFAIMMAASILSYRLVEQPLRRTKASLARIFTVYFAVPTVFILAVCGAVFSTGGFGVWRLDSSYVAQVDQMFRESGSSTSAPYVCQRFMLRDDMLTRPACRINASEEPPVLMWGDSNSGHYVGTVREIADAAGFGFRNISISSCPPILDAPGQYASVRFSDSCDTSVDLVRNILPNYDHMILAANWENHLTRHGQPFITSLGATIQALIDDGKTVMVIGRIPQLTQADPTCPIKALRFPFLQCAERGSVDRTAIMEVNRIVRLTAESLGATYLDFNDYLCDGTTCQGLIDGQPSYYDRDHLNWRGSERLGEAVRTDASILALFETFLSADGPLPIRENTPSPALTVNPDLSLMDPSDWRATALYRSGSNILLSDDRAASYQTASFEVDAATLATYPDARSATLEIVLDRPRSVFPMVRVRLDPTGERFEFLVDGETGRTLPRRDAGETDWRESVTDENMRLTIPFDLPAGTRSVMIELIPAASAPGQDYEYSRAHTGSLIIRAAALEFHEE